METTEKSKTPTAADLFDSLTLQDKKEPAADSSKSDASRPPAGARRGPSGPIRRGPPPNHRPTRSQEEALRARRAQPGGSKGPVEAGRSPNRRMERRPRRNSESSALDSEKDKNLTEEERKARDVRRRERERRHREARDKKPVNRKLDVIDQLDATSIYGTGLFHHDGPFDALNPHRNKRRNAPMQAFPKDSLNNILGGSGPLNKRADHSTLMGQHTEEAFKEWSAPMPKVEKPDTGIMFDPLQRDVLHGDESLGLGTSTFLEGTPAARAVIQTQEKERAQEMDGLQRKKSLAQRFRSVRVPREPRDYQMRRSPTEPTSAGLGDRSPFFSEFEAGRNEEQTISVRKASADDPTSPLRLERRVTTDGSGNGGESGGYSGAKASSSGGLLARVKSLKGVKRTRPGLSSQPEHVADGDASAPGTAV